MLKRLAAFYLLLLTATLSAQVIETSPESQKSDQYFNSYILKAVEKINTNHALLGYSINAALTHDLPYSNGEVVRASKLAPYTMCVAAQLEIILTAYDIYAQETGDYTIYDYLPRKSFESLTIKDLRGHLWVNHDFNSYGTADALINFGMGKRVPFEKLTSGSFVNINRTNKTGHAVTFIGFINANGKIQEAYNNSVIGFKYFSSQGKAESGGFDYRYAVFSKFACPETLPYKRDCNVIYSANQNLLNTGMMMAPAYWTHTSLISDNKESSMKETVFDGQYFNGVTTDD